MATIYQDPTSTVSSSWTAGGFADIDEGTRQPDAPADDKIRFAGPGGFTAVFGMSDPTATEVTSVKIWVYTTSYSGGADARIRIKIDGTWSQQRTLSDTSTGWHSEEFTSSDSLVGSKFELTQAYADSIQVEIYGSGGPGSGGHVYAMYNEMTGTSALPLPNMAVLGRDPATGNYNSITDGDSTPATTDGTDFGTMGVGAGALTIYQTNNDGGAELTLTDKMLIINGNIADIVVYNRFGGSKTMAAGNSGVAYLMIRTSVPGTYTGTASIFSDDASSPFTFDIKAIYSAGDISELTAVDPYGFIITDGTTGPVAANGTDLLSVETTGGTRTVTFTLRNEGDATVNLTGTPVVDLTTGTQFSVTVQPTDTALAPGEETTFTVEADPTTDGAKTDTISIDHDGTGSPYTFEVGVTGTATAPEINVKGNSQDIVSGDTTPATADDTDFGAITIGSSDTHTFTIENTGSGNLVLDDIPTIRHDDLSETNFIVDADPTDSPVASSGSITFTVTFTPTRAGTQTATVTIRSNDANEQDYTFKVSGSAITVGDGGRITRIRSSNRFKGRYQVRNPGS